VEVQHCSSAPAGIGLDGQTERVVCNVGSTTSWLMRLTSSPSSRFNTSSALTPAAHTGWFWNEVP